MVIKHTRRGLKQDRVLRSKQNWERGKGAKKIGNPRYKPVKRRDKKNVLRKVYILRKR
jgi:phage terminase large subunit GpA-like protein